MLQNQAQNNNRSYVAALVLGSGLTLGSGVASADAVTLSYSPWMPPGYVVSEVLAPWMERVEDVTEGRVKIVSRASGVGAPREQFEVVRDGLADVSAIVPGWTPGRFPLVEIAALPFLSSDNSVSAPVYYRTYMEHLDAHKPFSGTHVLTTWAVPSQHIFSLKGPIRDLEALSGLKMRVGSSSASDAVEALGAVPVTTSTAELYQMASGGIIDGGLFAAEITISYGIADFVKHFSLVPGGLTTASMALLVNEDKWLSITPEDRKAIMRISGEALAITMGNALEEVEQEARENLEAKGVTFETLAPEVVADMVEQLKPLDEQWVAKAMKAGLENPEQVLTDFRAELQAAEAEQL